VPLAGRGSSNGYNEPPLAFTAAFSADAAKLVQWKAFHSRSRVTAADLTLSQVVDAIAQFVWPPLDAARDGRAFASRWEPRGLWARSE
jgi:hypothetical protein